jgi:hypothetical protein
MSRVDESRNHMRVRGAILFAVLVVISGKAVSAIDLTLDRTAMRRAVDFARWPHSDDERARFHRRYIFDNPLPDAAEPVIIERIDVITPFRRLVQIAQQHASLNDLFGRPGLNDAAEAILPWRGQVGIIARVTFRSLDQVPVLLPQLHMLLDDQRPGAIRRLPSPACDDCVISGADVEGDFAATAPLMRGVRTAIVRLGVRPVVQVPIDFGDLE